MSQGKIHFPTPGGGAEEWTWKATRQTIVIRDPKRHKYAVRHERITGCTAAQSERAQWKQSPEVGVVTPAKVKRYIERELIAGMRR